MEVLSREFDIESTKKSYKNIVPVYNLWSRLTESKAAKYVIRYADIHDEETILEVACGTGIVFEQIIKRNPNGRNIGIDLSPDMLEKAVKRLKNHGNSNYELKEGNALELGLADNSIDLLINNFMVDLMPEDMFDGLADEFFRVIKPGGRVVISTFSAGKTKVNKFWSWVALRFPDLLTGCRPVSFRANLIKAGFQIENNLELSQNTFPSNVIKARKLK
ncbi:MAG: methyltransferase domain-containing protein [Chlorobi bacterium]|nr:methyltransferase domain-containing protein [Chlorobiota bacterium]